MLFVSLAALTAVSGAAAHAIVTAPAPRSSGTTQLEVCGAAVSKKINSDKTGPIENAAAAVDGDYDPDACDIWFCKGYQLSDNNDKVQSYKPGDVVNMKIDLVAHHNGYANVSVVDLASKKAIGSPLFLWPVYANTSLGPSKWPKNETDFNITIPDLGTQCAEVGACAIQWWWQAPGQTYESCVDFTA